MSYSKEKLSHIISDIVADLLFYNRKECEFLIPEEVNHLMDLYEVDIDWIIAEFEKELFYAYKKCRINLCLKVTTLAIIQTPKGELY